MRKYRITLFPVVALAILLAAVFALAKKSAEARQQNAAKIPVPMPIPMPMSPMTLVAPLFIEDDSTTSTITLANSMSKPVDVDVIVSGIDGNEIAKLTTALSSHTTQQIRLRDLLESASSYSPTYGSVLLQPHQMSTLAAQMSIVHHEGSVSDIEEEFAMLMEGSNPANFRAVAANLAAPPVIAIRSLSATKRLIRIDCLYKTEHRINSDISIDPCSAPR